MSPVSPARWSPGRPTLWGTFGGGASSDWFSAAAGMAMLEAGGNAFDAAVAAGVVLSGGGAPLCRPRGAVGGPLLPRPPRGAPLRGREGPPPRGGPPPPLH